MSSSVVCRAFVFSVALIAVLRPGVVHAQQAQNGWISTHELQSRRHRQRQPQPVGPSGETNMLRILGVVLVE
jgi:hypothetical protein